MEKSELSFSEKLKEARRAAMKTISSGEASAAPVKEKKPELPKPVADLPAKPATRTVTPVIKRPYVRNTSTLENTLFEEQNSKKREIEISDQIADRDRKRQAKIKLQSEIDTLRHFEDRQPKEQPKPFELIIGQPNSKGETPVMFAPGTTAYVKRGRDIQESINKWLNRNTKAK